MQPTFTLSEFSDVISTTEGRREPERVRHQLKGLAARGLLTSVAGAYGPKGALLYTEREIYRARLLMAAIDLGVISDDLAAIDSAMRAESCHVFPVGGHVTVSLAAAVESLSAEKTTLWILELVRVRSFETGEITNLIGWSRDGNRFDRPDPLVAENKDCYAIGPIEAVLSIPFVSIARPLWLHLRARSR